VQGADNKTEMKERVASPDVRNSMEQVLATQKTVQRLVDIAKGSKNAPQK
jgi:hypothetical protein